MSKPELMMALSNCLSLLRMVEEKFWGEKIERVTARGPNLSQSDADEIMGWFGGMGSFNDLLIARINGHVVSPEQEPELNERLSELRRTIFDEATKLRRV